MKNCTICGRPKSPKRPCAHNIGEHGPTPEHYVARVRKCLRCREGFDSSYAGDRVCPTCRERESMREAECIRRGDTPALYLSPFEPDYLPLSLE